MADLIDAEILWADQTCPYGCCDCCNGYCPREDSPETATWRWPLLVLTFNGVDYIADKYVALRRDQLDPATIPAEDKLTAHSGTPDFFFVPDEMPPLSEGPCSAALMHSIHRAGLTRHAFRDHYVHLYREGQHVGWSTIAKPGAMVIQPSDLLLIQKVAAATTLPVGEIAAVLRHAGVLRPHEDDLAQESTC